MAEWDGMREAVEAAGGHFEVLDASVSQHDDKDGFVVRLALDEENYMEFSFNSNGSETMEMLLNNASDMVQLALHITTARDRSRLN